MYLVGNLSDRDFFQLVDGPKFKVEITTAELAKTKENSDYQVIDLLKMKYFDPDKNEWVDIERET